MTALPISAKVTLRPEMGAHELEIIVPDRVREIVGDGPGVLICIYEAIKDRHPVLLSYGKNFNHIGIMVKGINRREYDILKPLLPDLFGDEMYYMPGFGHDGKSAAFNWSPSLEICKIINPNAELK